MLIKLSFFPPSFIYPLDLRIKFQRIFKRNLKIFEENGCEDKEIVPMEESTQMKESVELSVFLFYKFSSDGFIKIELELSSMF